MGADSSKGGGKLGKSKRGWGNLPPDILHRIIDHELDTFELPKYMRYSYEGRDESSEVASVVAKRVWLCDLRRVSPDWQKAVDSLSFWPTYSTTINPTRIHVHLGLNKSRTTSSKSSRSLLQQALFITTNICHLCRINRPDLVPRRVASLSKLPTNKFGYLASCDIHTRHHYCCNCLIDEIKYKGIDDDQRTLPPAMIAHCYRDVDEEGREYTLPFSCRRCRQGSFDYELDKMMIACARGGPIRAPPASITQMGPARSYFSLGSNSARTTVRACLTNVWLEDHANLSHHLDVAHALQGLENAVKTHFLQTFEAEPRALSQRREQVLAENMWKMPMDDVQPRVRAMREQTLSLYREWRDEVEEDDIEPINDMLDIYWSTEASDAAIYNFIRLQIRSGIWVSPIDQVNACLGHIDITPLQELNRSSQLPPGVSHRSDRRYQKESNLRTPLFDDDDRQTFLPPDDLVLSLGKQYRTVLCRYLRRPIEVFVADQLKRGRSSDGVFAEPSEVLHYIATHAQCWGPFVDHDHALTHTLSMDKKDRLASPVRSPVIQLVSDSSDEEEEEVEGRSQNGFMIRAELDEEEKAAVLASAAENLHMVEQAVMSARAALSGYEVDDSDDSDEEDDYEDWEYSDPKQQAADGVVQPSPAIELLSHHPEAVTASGKRKTPPDDYEQEVATKRRLSDDGKVVELSEASTENPENDPNDPESRDSSPSGPTEPLPLTPDLSIDAGPGLAIRDGKNADTGINAGADADVNGTMPQPLIAYNDLPHVPPPNAKLGPRTERIIRDLLDAVLEPVRACHCKVCERGRRLEELRSAQMEAMLRLNGV